MARRITVGIFALVVLAIVFGLIFLREEAPPEPDLKLLVLSPHWLGIKEEFSRGFREYYRKRTSLVAEIEWLDQGGTSSIRRYIENKFSASPEGIGVDLFFGGGIAPHLRLAEKGHFEAYRPPRHVLNDIPKDLAGIPVYDEKYRWFGACFSGFGIVYNKAVGDRMKLPAISTWADLADPNLRGWVASGDPRSSGSVHMMYEIMLQAYGFEKGYGVICRMSGNVKAFNEGGSSVPRDVGLAESYCGPSIDFYAWEQVVRHGPENIGYAVPAALENGKTRGLTVIGADPVAILKGAPHRSAAEKFVDFVLSDEGQKLWYFKPGEDGGPKRFGLNRMPVRRSMYQHSNRSGVKYNPFEWEGGFRYDAKKASRRWVIVNDLFKASIYDVHEELRDAWIALHNAMMPPEAVELFERSPASEAELEGLAKGNLWGEQKIRNDTMRRWTERAREKFGQVVERCGAGRRR